MPSSIASPSPRAPAVSAVAATAGGCATPPWRTSDPALGHDTEGAR
jgi:hypothetical protein